MADETANTHECPRRAAIVFVACALVLMLVPFVGMLWARTDSTSENRELAPAPSLSAEDGGINVDVLADAGTYFEDHFAYRNDLVDANAHMRAVLGASATDQVIVGSDGWLYYGGTLADYVGPSRLSDRTLANIAHNLSLLQGYAASRGAAFAFAVAPNKNTLYGAGMPAHYLRSPEPSNYERLKPILAEYGVNTVDLPGILQEKAQAGERLYCYRDTHWTNEGALVGANALLEAVGAPALNVAADQWVVRDDLVGDVAGMLYPAHPGTESEAYAVGINDGPGLSGASWAYVAGADVTDNEVATKSAAAKAQAGDAKPQSLMMYRDSFGNALIPYLSSTFASASYSKLVPYSAAAIDAAEADAVIVERAERHLAYLAEAPFIMPAPRVRMEAAALAEAEDVGTDGATLEAKADGGFVVLEGWLGEAAVEGADAKARILVAVDAGLGEPAAYEAFSRTGDAGDWGYSIHVPREAFGDTDKLAAVTVFLMDGSEVRPIARYMDVSLP